ncbi:CPBP family intramembrane glutamic endopeptidase [Clostridium sp.]|uniref:CPBP family intramembrane glutamic endopeptidase n=1 Tax=Clostridium sp. TaxID=1506 RepID=UPI0032176157
MKFIGNLFIIIMLYILPLIIYLKSVTFNKNSGLIKSIVTIGYIGIYFLLPEMFTNILPFILILFILIHWKNSEEYRKEYEKYRFSLGEFKLRKAIKYVAITYGLILIAATISYYVLLFFNIPMEQQDVVTMLDNYDLISFSITVPFTVIFAPVVEEFTFRYILFSKLFRDNLNRRVSFLTTAFIVSTLFAGAHFSITAFAMLFTISFYNCYLIEKKGFWYAVFTHVVINGVTTTALLVNKLL